MASLRVIQANLGHARSAEGVKRVLTRHLPKHDRWVILACEAHRLEGRDYAPDGGAFHQEPFKRGQGNTAWNDPFRGRAEVAVITGPGVDVEASELVPVMDGPMPPTKYQHDRYAMFVWAAVEGERFLFVSSHFQANVQRHGVVNPLRPVSKAYASGVGDFCDRLEREAEKGYTPVFGADLNYRPSRQPWKGDPYKALQGIGMAVRNHKIDAIATDASNTTWDKDLRPVKGSPGTDHLWLVADVRTHKGETVPDIPDPLERITFRGKTMDRKTAAALAVAERRLGYELTITQGAYNPGGVGASGGTHDRGGVVDLAKFDADRKVKVLRDLGFAAWRRMPSQGPWLEHIHAVMVGHQDLSPAAAQQVVDYQAGLNGLATKAPDSNPYRPDVEPFNFAKAWRDDLLRARITGINARIKALRDKVSALRAEITYKGGKK